MPTKGPNIGGASVASTVDNPMTLDTPVSDGQKKAFAGVGVLCLVLVLGVTVFKFMTSRRSGERTRGQDVSFGASVVLFIAFIVSSICMFSFGDAENIMAFADSSVASASFYIATLVGLRIAFLCLFQDVVFRGTQYWKFSIFLAAGFSTYSVLFIFLNAFQCKPMAPIAADDRCIDLNAVDIAFGIMDFIVNIVVLSMPAKAIWGGRDHQDSKNRWCYPIAYTLGVIACVLTLLHAIAPATIMTTRSLFYPLMAVLTLTVMFLAFAVVLIPTFIRCEAGPIQSPTTTHPHLQARSTSVLSWIPGHRNPSADDFHRGRSDSTDTSIKELPTDLEKSTEDLPTVLDAKPTQSVEDLDGRTLDGRTQDGRANSLRSFSRLGSLTGAVKPPSFLANRQARNAARQERQERQDRPGDLDVNGINVTTEVEMSYEERQRRQSRNQSPHKPSSADTT